MTPTKDARCSPSESNRVNDLVIRPARLEDGPILEQALPRSTPGLHEMRAISQLQGRLVYLIAWEGERPVGHLILSWERPKPEEVEGPLPDCPHLSDIAVHPQRQSRGIGTKLIREAQRLVLEGGYSRVGLSVGVDNSGARRLYRRLGYRETESEPFAHTWPYTDENGAEGVCSEICVDMVKSLPEAM